MRHNEDLAQSEYGNSPSPLKMNYKTISKTGKGESLTKSGRRSSDSLEHLNNIAVKKDVPQNGSVQNSMRESLKNMTKRTTGENSIDEERL